MSVVSGIIAGESADNAADSQVSASRQATKAQLKMYEEGREDTAPWREAGKNALTTLVQKVNAGPGDYYKSPGYKFRLSEGEKAIERSAAGRGGLLSGAAAKAMQRYGQDYATGDYQNFLANYYNSLTPYQSLANVGQTTASQNAISGNQVASQIGQNEIAAGQAQAAGAINTSNAVTGAINSGVNNYMLWKYMNGAGTTAAAIGATSPAYVSAAENAAAGSWLDALG